MATATKVPLSSGIDIIIIVITLIIIIIITTTTAAAAHHNNPCRLPHRHRLHVGVPRQELHLIGIIGGTQLSKSNCLPARYYALNPCPFNCN